MQANNSVNIEKTIISTENPKQQNSKIENVAGSI
jgi:hypothetical protein